MKNKISLFIVIIVVGAFLLSCQSGDNKTANEPTTMNSDSTVRAIPDTVINKPVSNDSTAKPVSAVKAKKGKVSSVMTINNDNKNAEVFPLFPGGQAALDKFIAANVVYPADALEEGIEGTVIVEFEVDKFGMIYTPHVTSNKIGYGLEIEAMKVVNKMPLWTPGTIKGKNVKTHYRLPVTFKLAD